MIGTTKWIDEQYIDAPWSNHVVQLATSEAVALGFAGINVTETEGFKYEFVTRVFDSKDRRYYYSIRGRMPIISGSFGHVIATAGFVQESGGWTIREGVIVSDIANEQYPLTRKMAGTNDYYEALYNSVGALQLTTEISALMCSTFNVTYERVYTNFRFRGEKG